MTLPRRTRRRIDAIVAAALAVIVTVVAAVLWARSDARATTLIRAETQLDAPHQMRSVPQALREVWRSPTDPRYGAVASPYGSVVVADQHTVTGLDAADGTELWSYTRSNRDLCGIGSGDWRDDSLSAWTGVHGVMSVFAKNGYCSQVTLHDPTTGERLYQRTSPGSQPGRLVFGSPYASWVGDDYLELWRHDLVATIRYGDQPNPVNPDGPHTGCTFSDVAMTADQLATIEHCAEGTTVVLNWPTPSDAPGDHKWDANHTEPKATVTLGDTPAVIIGVTGDRVAVLVADPAPAIVVYDDSGAETSRTPVDLPAADISPALSDSTIYDDRRFTVVGSTLLVTAPTMIEVPDTSAEDDADSEATDEAPPADAEDIEPATKAVDDPRLDWVVSDVLGLPAVVGDSVLIPVAAGLEVVDSDTGETTATIPVDRGGYVGRVDVSVVGAMVIEVRGDTVVALTAD